MAARSPRCAWVLASALTLGGCVTQGPFPSLAPRPGEGDISIAEPQRPDTATSNDPALAQQVATLRAQAQDGQTAFDAAYGRTAAAVARAGAQGSDSWSAAQEALSRLEAARGLTIDALAAFDRLATERADLPTSRTDMASIDAAMADAARLADAQSERIAELRRRIGG
jgi:hypothetical protein